MSAILPSSSSCCTQEICSPLLIVQVPGPAGPAGPQGESASGETAGWFLKPNLAAARAVPADPINTLMVMLGGAVAGDGFGGILFWDPTSTALDDYTTTGGSVINPIGNSAPGRWIRYL